jgi:hypothetical protein
MTGAFIFLAVCLAVAVLAMAPLWILRRPHEGWRAWVAGSFEAFRDGDQAGRARDTNLEELFREAEPDLPGYTTAEELRDTLADTREAVRR